MRSLALSLLLIIISISSCKSGSYNILEVKESSKENPENYLESLLVTDSNSPDTLLYYKFYADKDDYDFKQSPLLNIGFSFTKHEEGEYSSFGATYLGVAENKKLHTLQTIRAGNKSIFSNYEREGLEKRFGRSVLISMDSLHPNPVSASHFAKQEDMEQVLELFGEEIAKALKKDKRLKYLLSASASKTETTVEMTVDFK